MPKLVVSTATLGCSCGASPAPFLATGLGQVMFGGALPTGTIQDHIPGTNIFPFGMCTKLGAMCVPVTPAPWSMTTDVWLGFQPALSQAALLPCALGGVIFVVDPGQHTVDVDKYQAMFDKNAKKLGDRIAALAEALGSGKKLTKQQSLLQQSIQGAAMSFGQGGLTACFDIAANHAGDVKYAKRIAAISKGLSVLGYSVDAVSVVSKLYNKDYKGAAEAAATAGVSYAMTAACTTAIDVGTEGTALVVEPVVVAGCGVASSAAAPVVVNEVENHPVEVAVAVGQGPMGVAEYAGERVVDGIVDKLF